MKLFPTKRMYVPALTIVGVAALLLLTISISTYKNLHAEKIKNMGYLTQQGTMLIKVLEAGERAGMLMPLWGAWCMMALLQFHRTSDDESPAYLSAAARGCGLDADALEQTPQGCGVCTEAL